MKFFNKALVSFIIFTLSLVALPVNGMFVLQLSQDNNDEGVGTSVAVAPAPDATGQLMVDNVDDHTAREEAEGKEVWEKLQAKEISCESLSDDDFGALGEYGMGLMVGSSHETMNEMMIRMHGEEGEEQMHIAMGKRISGCDPDTLLPYDTSSGMMPMMNMFGRGLLGDRSDPTSKSQYNTSMMNFGVVPFGWFGWIFMVLFWVFVIVGIIALIKWLADQSKGERRGPNAPLEILKDRYAKGEIDKKEFEEKKKDLL